MTKVPDIILRALSGQWKPIRRQLPMNTEQLAADLGVTPWVAGRLFLAHRSFTLAMRGKSEHLAGTMNGQVSRVLKAADWLREAGDLAMAALTPMPDAGEFAESVRGVVEDAAKARLLDPPPNPTPSPDPRRDHPL